MQTTLAPPEESAGAPASGPPSISSSIATLGELKKGLLDLGYNFQLNYTGEVLGNPTGGAKQRAIYEDLLEMVVDGDLNKIAGLSGSSFHINAYIVNGPGLSTCCVFNVLTISTRGTAKHMAL